MCFVNFFLVYPVMHRDDVTTTFTVQSNAYFANAFDARNILCGFTFPLPFLYFVVFYILSILCFYLRITMLLGFGINCLWLFLISLGYTVTVTCRPPYPLFLGEGPRLVAFSVGWVSTVPGNWSLYWAFLCARVFGQGRIFPSVYSLSFSLFPCLSFLASVVADVPTVLPVGGLRLRVPLGTVVWVEVRVPSLHFRPHSSWARRTSSRPCPMPPRWGGIWWSPDSFWLHSSWREDAEYLDLLSSL